VDVKIGDNMNKKFEAGEPNVELVTIRSFSSEAEAELARTELESAGIKSFLSGDDCGGLRPAMTFTNGIKLVVRAEDVARAAEILNEV
jgi:Putative prokaryotic signal transducing protein